MSENLHQNKTTKQTLVKTFPSTAPPQYNIADISENLRSRDIDRPEFFGH